MGRLSSVNLSCVCVLSALRLYFACVYVFVCFLGGCVQISPFVGCFVLVPSKVSFPYPGGYFRRTARFVSLFLSLSPSLSFCYYIKFYSDSDSVTSCNSPFSYRQPYGNGQLLSRRYCRHSGWLFSCALRTASEFQGALAVSRKYFKQSKWPLSAARSHAYAVYLRYLRSTRYSSMWR